LTGKPAETHRGSKKCNKSTRSAADGSRMRICSCLSLAAPNLVEYYAVDDLEDASEATLRALPRRERRSVKDPVMLKLVLDEQHGQGHGHGGKAALLIAERSLAWPWSRVGLDWFVIKIERGSRAWRGDYLPTEEVHGGRKACGRGCRRLGWNCGCYRQRLRDRGNTNNTFLETDTMQQAEAKLL
jgi:hypothetical protein